MSAENLEPLPEGKSSLQRPLDAATELALLRTELALERTQLAWARGTFSLITAGFAVDKGILALRKARVLAAGDWVESSHLAGLILCGLSTLFLSLATGAFLRHSRELNRFRPEPALRIRTALLLTGLVVSFGVGSTILLLTSG